MIILTSLSISISVFFSLTAQTSVVHCSGLDFFHELFSSTVISTASCHSSPHSQNSYSRRLPSYHILNLYIAYSIFPVALHGWDRPCYVFLNISPIPQTSMRNRGATTSNLHAPLHMLFLSTCLKLKSYSQRHDFI
ncbi:hypothetical protein BDQ17DRAFT_1345512, partial [Cyathus striatus]